jgi:hypothetical protein
MEILGSIMPIANDDAFIKSVERLYERKNYTIKLLRKTYKDSV